MTARRDLARVAYAAERELARMTRPLGPAVAASVRRHAEDGRITALGARATMRDVDRMLSTVYPAAQGAPSRLEAMIVRRGKEAQRAPIAASVEELRSRLDPTLLYLMGDTP